MTNINVTNYKQIINISINKYKKSNMRVPCISFLPLSSYLCQECERSRDTMYTTIISILFNKKICKTCA